MVWYEVEWYVASILWYDEMVWRSYYSGMGYLQGLLIQRIG